MTGDGVAPSSAPVAGDSGEQEVPNVTLPAFTSTISGLPISVAYAGAANPFRFNFGTRSRSSSFHLSQQSYRSSDTGMRNKYVPQRRGSTAEVVKQKTMEGTGEVFTDPMDEFKPQNFKETRRSTDIGNGADEHKRREPAGKYRGAGKEAYRQENRGNSETSVNRQLRYKQG
jgi:hypothetical protein